MNEPYHFKDSFGRYMMASLQEEDKDKYAPDGRFWVWFPFIPENLPCPYHKDCFPELLKRGNWQLTTSPNLQRDLELLR